MISGLFAGSFPQPSGLPLAEQSINDFEISRSKGQNTGSS